MSCCKENVTIEENISDTGFFQIPGAQKAGFLSMFDRPKTKRLIAAGNQQAAGLQLEPGQYRQVSTIIAGVHESKFVENVDHTINYKGELKRIRFSKIEYRNVTEPQPGEFEGRQILEYQVIDGPLSPEIVAKAASDIVTGAPASNVKIREVYEYTNFGFKEMLVLAGTVFTIFFFGLRLLKGK